MIRYGGFNFKLFDDWFKIFIINKMVAVIFGFVFVSAMILTILESK